MEEFLIIAICLLLNAILAATEMAFVTVTKPRLRDLVKAGHRSAEIILKLRENPERTLSVIQIGITLVGALAAAVGGAGAHESLSPYLANRFSLRENTAEVISLIIVVIPLTAANVIFAELVPKTLALRNPQRIVLRAANWLVAFDRIFLPIVDFLEWSTKRVLAVFFPRKISEQPAGVNPETVELDLLSLQARQYILNLVNIEKKRVKDVSLPWAQVDHVSIYQNIHEVEAMVFRSGHTRLPVMKDGAVIGIINTKELLAIVKAGIDKWDHIVRSISQLQEGDTLLKALRQMQEKRSHLSAVFSGTELRGIVTMEDILEEVIGEVYDEDDDGALKRILSTSGRVRTKT